MKYKILGLLAVGLLCASTANASLLRLDATSLDVQSSDFFVVFDDTGDGLLELTEVTFFSGVSNGTSGTALEFPILSGVPTIPDISIFDGGGPLCFDLVWCFKNDKGYTAIEGPHIWTYEITGILVPEPGTLALLGLGLAGLGFTRRRCAP